MNGLPKVPLYDGNTPVLFVVVVALATGSGVDVGAGASVGSTDVVAFGEVPLLTGIVEFRYVAL